MKYLSISSPNSRVFISLLVFSPVLIKRTSVVWFAVKGNNKSTKPSESPPWARGQLFVNTLFIYFYFFSVSDQQSSFAYSWGRATNVSVGVDLWEACSLTTRCRPLCFATINTAYSQTVMEMPLASESLSPIS